VSIVWWNELNKHRINTTISAKHWEILNKHTKNFETQQKVLEAALERLENGSKQNPALSQEEAFWVRIGRDHGHNFCVLHKNIVKECLKFGGFERANKMANEMNLIETQIVSIYKKRLKECNLKEIMDAIVWLFKIANIFDVIEYKDHSNFYLLSMTHYLNLEGGSQTSFKLLFEKLFEKYGVKTESEITENNFLMKIYKIPI
jgi:hypothetical protein